MMKDTERTISPSALDFTLVMHCGSVRLTKSRATFGAERLPQRGLKFFLVDQTHFEIWRCRRRCKAQTQSSEPRAHIPR